MKTLLILRHGKAQSDAPHGDHARELTGRGRRNAEAIGAHIATLVGAPDAIVTSDAARAMQTAQIAASAMGFDKALVVEPQLYDADLSTLLAAVRGIADDIGTTVLVGHNPGLEELASALPADDVRAIVLPTAGLVHLEFDVDHWADIREGTGRWKGLTAPRTLG